MLYLIKLKHFISNFQKFFHRLKNKSSTYAQDLNFRTMNDLAFLVRNNVKRLPSDIDLVVGIPRSGIIPAYLIALFLNKNVCSINEFINNITPAHGEREINSHNNKERLKILVVDDSVLSGLAIKKAKEKLKDFDNSKYEFLYCAVFAAEQSKNMVDYYFELVEQPRMFQWNYLNHTKASESCFDLDGVLCTDPTDEQNDDGEKYLDFIKNAKPLFIPSYKIYAIVTARLEKYRKETEAWLEKNNVTYEHLYMLDLPDMQKRRELGCHGEYKAKIYKKLKNCKYFMESNREQAIEIAKLANKQVICVETDELIKPF